jgi:hypothetical protein
VLQKPIGGQLNLDPAQTAKVVLFLTAINIFRYASTMPSRKIIRESPWSRVEAKKPSSKLELPMPILIAALGDDRPPHKRNAGHYRFRCPHCGAMRATVNPRNNLAHCVDCSKKLNNINLLLTLGYDFRGAVGVLERLLDRFDKLQGKRKEAAT